MMQTQISESYVKTSGKKQNQEIFTKEEKEKLRKKGFENITDSLYLRVILNSACNAKCYFCHEEGQNTKENLPKDVILEAVKEAASLGFKKVKYTGGEPLLRKDLVEITRSIKAIDPEIEISMTTNGIRLKETIDSLLEAGLDRVNVSLHSLDRENYKKITKVDALDKVLEGLDYLKQKGLKDVKINFTLSSYNLHEVFDLAKYAKKQGFQFRIHDLLPSNKEAEETLIPKKDIEDFLDKECDYKEVINKDGKNISRYYKDGSSVDIKGATYHEKCKQCEYTSKCNEGIYALRLSAEGMLRPCLYRDDLQIDFVKSMINGTTKQDMTEAYRRVAL
jgi:cyclic pyranopterin phosphate synthase